MKPTEERARKHVDYSSHLSLDGYQDEAMKTAIYPERHRNPQYPALGLCGEAGEVANKVKKIYRDAGGRIEHESREALAEELGDVLWYVALLADEINLSLNNIAVRNLLKLRDRHSREAIHGSGDKR